MTRRRVVPPALIVEHLLSGTGVPEFLLDDQLRFTVAGNIDAEHA